MKRESISRLVRVIAGEKNPHFLISRVAADARLLELVKKIHGEAGAAAHSPVKSSVTALCETNHITPEFFWERVRLVVYTLQLAPEGEDDDLYATLQLERSATREEIKAAYRRLSLRHHPDRNPGDPQAVEAFMKIHRAYQVLSQEKSREEYDRKLTVPLWNEGYSHSREESPKPQMPPLQRYSPGSGPWPFPWWPYFSWSFLWTSRMFKRENTTRNSGRPLTGTSLELTPRDRPKPRKWIPLVLPPPRPGSMRG